MPLPNPLSECLKSKRRPAATPEKPKALLVGGAGTDLGIAIAKQVRDAGFIVDALSLPDEIDTFSEKFGNEHDLFKANISSIASVKECLAEALKKTYELVVFNCNYEVDRPDTAPVGERFYDPLFRRCVLIPFLIGHKMIERNNESKLKQRMIFVNMLKDGTHYNNSIRQFYENYFGAFKTRGELMRSSKRAFFVKAGMIAVSSILNDMHANVAAVTIYPFAERANEDINISELPEDFNIRANWEIPEAYMVRFAEVIFHEAISSAVQIDSNTWLRANERHHRMDSHNSCLPEPKPFKKALYELLEIAPTEAEAAAFREMIPHSWQSGLEGDQVQQLQPADQQQQN